MRPQCVGLSPGLWLVARGPWLMAHGSWLVRRFLLGAAQPPVARCAARAHAKPWRIPLCRPTDRVLAPQRQSGKEGVSTGSARALARFGC